MIIERLLGKKYALATEDTGGVQLERELVFYVKMTDLKVLDELPCVEHVQWQLDLTSPVPNARWRARLEDNKVHSITCKIPHTSGEGMVEATSITDPDFWEFHVRNFGHHGYKKTRYNYAIPNTNLKFEIDVFLSESGQPHPYVKVDLEYPHDLPELPNFPFAVDEDTAIDGTNPTPEEKKFIDDLWENEWSRLDSAKGDLDPYYNPKR